MKRLIRIIILVVLVSAVILSVRWFLNAEGNQSASELRIYGNIDIRKADLAFNEQERIAQVLVEEGDRVTAGQVLARLQTNRLEAQIREIEATIGAQQEVVKRLQAGTRRQEIEQARAEVAAAQARVKNAMKNYERVSKTSGAGAT
ncbi:MAG: biotin/lipoyl-binding protein, partial [Desulfobacterales bacterium]